MSLIGPRPDYVEHALVFVECIPIYRLRHVVRPGMSGHAQILLGYAEGIERASQKANLDLLYIRNAGWSLEAAILARTIQVLLLGHWRPASEMDGRLPCSGRARTGGREGRSKVSATTLKRCAGDFPQEGWR